MVLILLLHQLLALCSRLLRLDIQHRSRVDHLRPTTGCPGTFSSSANSRSACSIGIFVELYHSVAQMSSERDVVNVIHKSCEVC